MQIQAIMDINERFETIIKVLFKGNKRAFAKAVGISPTVVENVVGARKGKPSYDVLVKVCANANISAEWLLLGIGDLAMDMFTIRKNLTIEAPYEDEDGTERTMKTVFTKAPSSPQPIPTDDKPIVEHLSSMLKDKDKEIGDLHEKIGSLKERIAQLEHEKNDSLASYQTAPRETSKSIVDL